MLRKSFMVALTSCTPCFVIQYPRKANPRSIRLTNRHIFVKAFGASVFNSRRSIKAGRPFAVGGKPFPPGASGRRVGGEDKYPLAPPGYRSAVQCDSRGQGFWIWRN